MGSLQHIIAGTDFSSAARHAADRAARLAQQSGARLQLVHVLNAGALGQLQQMLGGGAAVESAVIAQSRQALAALAAELHSAHGVAVEARLLQGAVVHALCAEAAPADLAVLGTRSTALMRRLVLGSTTERLLRKSTRPVLVVKQRAHERYRRVLVAVDFSAWSTPLIALAQRVAPGAHLLLLHANELPFEGKLRYASVPEHTIQSHRMQARALASQRLAAVAAAAGLRPGDWTPCLPHGDASRAIIEQEQEGDCDLIVLGKHGQHMAEDLLLGSVTENVLAESVGDVLVSTAGAA